MGDLACNRVRTDPLIFVLPSDHRLASQDTIAPQDIVNEFLSSATAPACASPFWSISAGPAGLTGH